jgi:hypothetical protein
MTTSTSRPASDTSPTQLSITGLDAAHTYQVGDPDPMPNARSGCFREHRGWVCTLPAGHTRPQHLAGTGRTVVHVWPVAR